MEDLTDDIRTPPLPLIGLVGMPDLHPQIIHYLRAEQPPLSALSVPDYGGVVALQGKDRRPLDVRMPPPHGILKAGWLAKYRHRCPSTISIFFEAERVFGDASEWAMVCSQFDAIRASISRGRSAKMVICIVQHSPGEVNEERALALKKRADLEPRCCMFFATQDPVDLKRSLSRFTSVVSDLSRQYYGEQGRRVKLRLERRTFSSPELNVRYNFKVAVYGEFRRDWMAAVKYYSAAYASLREVMTAPMELQPVQRTMELKMVAELLNMKACNLLLHLGNTDDAIKQFRRHIGMYQHLIGPAEGEFLHWGWVSRQFRLFGELLQQRFVQTSSQPGFVANLIDRELQPAYYFKVASRYTRKRRKAYEDALILESFAEEVEDVLDGGSDQVGPPLYVGQPPRILNRGITPDLQRPTEAEYLRHMLQLEKRVPHTAEVVEMLTKARELYKRVHGQRTMHEIVFEIGREYFHAEDYAAAKRALDSVIGLYRKEAWVLLLAVSLAYLRECAKQLGMRQAFVEYSLEFSTLPLPKSSAQDLTEAELDEEIDRLVLVNGRFDEVQRRLVYREVVGLLRGERTIKGVRESEEWRVDAKNPLDLAMGEASPLCVVMSAVATFSQRTVRPHETAQLTIAVLTHLPADLHLTEVELVFTDPVFGCTLVAGEKPDDEHLPGDKGEETSDSEVQDMADEGSEGPPKADKKWGYDLTVNPGKWKRFSLDVNVRDAGRVECVAIVARVGPHATISCQVDVLGLDVPPIWAFEPGAGKPPFRDTEEVVLGQRWVEVEEPEVRVAVEIDCSGIGVVGEALPIRVGVRSRGDRVKVGTLQLHLSPLIGVDDGGGNDAGIGGPGKLEREKTMSGSLMLSPVSAMKSGGFDLGGLVPAELYEIPSHLLDADDGWQEGRVDGDGDDDEGCFLPLVGTIHVPGITPDGAWSTVVFIRWRAAVGVSLTAVLEYELEGETCNWTRASDLSSNRTLRVKKAVEIKCEEPFATSARFVGHYRRQALLPGVAATSGGIGGVGGSSSASMVPLDMDSSLIVTARGASSLGIQILSIAIDPDESGGCEVYLPRGQKKKGSVNGDSHLGIEHDPTTLGNFGDEEEDGGYGEDGEVSGHVGPTINVGSILQKDESLTEVFQVRPTIPGSMVRVGTLRVTWEPYRGDTDIWAFESCVDQQSGRKGENRSPAESTVGQIPVVGEGANLASRSKDDGADGCGETLRSDSAVRQERVITAAETELDASLRNLRNAWCRFGRVVTTRVELPSMHVEDPPVVAVMSAPPYGLLGVPFPLTLTLVNRTTMLQEILFSVADAQSFVFSGAHKGTASVLPMSSCKLKYCAVAVASGMLQLPSINVTVLRYGASLYHATENLKLYVYPAAPRVPNFAKVPNKDRSDGKVFFSGAGRCQVVAGDDEKAATGRGCGTQWLTVRGGAATAAAGGGGGGDS